MGEKKSLECRRRHIWALKTQKLPGPFSRPWTPTTNAPCRNFSNFFLKQQDQSFLFTFYHWCLWEKILLNIYKYPIELIPKWYCTGWVWYPQIFQHEVGLNHMYPWKSVNIRAILRYTGKILDALPNIKYNNAVLFWNLFYWVNIYVWKYFLS